MRGSGKGRHRVQVCMGRSVDEGRCADVEVSSHALLFGVGASGAISVVRAILVWSRGACVPLATLNGDQRDGLVESFGVQGANTDLRQVSGTSMVVRATCRHAAAISANQR